MAITYCIYDWPIPTPARRVAELIPDLVVLCTQRDRPQDKKYIFALTIGAANDYTSYMRHILGICKRRASNDRQAEF